jgi:hypothetical protein
MARTATKTSATTSQRSRTRPGRPPERNWAARFYLVDANGANAREITPDDRHKALVGWSPDGSRLAYLAYDQQADGPLSNSATLCVTEVAMGETHQAPGGDIQDFVWLPDGPSLLAIVRGDDLVALEVYDANGVHERRLFEAGTLRDAARLTLGPGEDTGPMTDPLYISAIDGSATVPVGSLAIEGPIVWSPGSTRIAISSVSTPTRAAVFVMNAGGTDRREIITLAGTGAMIYGLAWRPRTGVFANRPVSRNLRAMPGTSPSSGIPSQGVPGRTMFTTTMFVPLKMALRASLRSPAAGRTALPVPRRPRAPRPSDASTRAACARRQHCLFDCHAIRCSHPRCALQPLDYLGPPLGESRPVLLPFA